MSPTIFLWVLIPQIQIASSLKISILFHFENSYKLRTEHAGPTPTPINWCWNPNSYDWSWGLWRLWASVFLSVNKTRSHFPGLWGKRKRTALCRMPRPAPPLWARVVLIILSAMSSLCPSFCFLHIPHFSPTEIYSLDVMSLCVHFTSFKVVPNLYFFQETVSNQPSLPRQNNNVYVKISSDVFVAILTILYYQVLI